jgi:hypothetical protein
VSFWGIATGDCLLTPDEWATDASSQARFWRDQPGGAWPDTYFAVPCDEPHGAEAYFVGERWEAEATFPGVGLVQVQWSADCAEEYQAYAGIPVDQSGLDLTGWTQDAEGWAMGLRYIACIAYDPGGADLEGSLRGAGQ